MEWFYIALRFVFTAIPFVVAFLLPLLLFYGAWSFYYRPVTAIRWVIWVFVIETIMIIQPVLPLGIKLFIPDLVFLLIGMAGVLRIFTIKLHREHYVWLLFGAALMLSFALGVIQYGTKAGVEFRAYFYFWAGVWYFMTFPLSTADVDKIARSWVFASAILVVVVSLRWVAQALGMDIARYWNDGGGSLRVFNAAQTYFLATAFLIAFYSHLNKTGPKWWGSLLPLLLVCIVVLQHRTLWVVTVVSIGVLFLAAGKIRSKAVSTFLVAALVGTAVLVPLFTGGKLDTVQQSLVHSVQEVGQENSTMTWRVQSWRALVEQWAHGGPVVNLIGYPFGSGYERHIEATQNELTQSPQSQYVTVLMRTGMIGIVAMLAVYYLAIKAMRRINSHASSQTVDSKLLLALLIGQLLFFITYSVHYSQLIPLGLSLVMLGQFRRQPTKDEGAPMLSGATQGVSGSHV
jgi:hypothetical protein